MRTAFIITWLVAGLSTASAQQQGSSAAEAKLREMLKSVTQRATTAEAEAATLKAEKASTDAKLKELEDKVKTMGRQIETLGGELADVKAASVRTETDLKAQLIKSDESIRKHQKSLDKWKAAHIEISGVARKKEKERAEYAAKYAAMERRASDLRTRNGELFRTANEILDRYRKFSLGQALAAREPFTGITRVKLQNLMQEYQDSLLSETAEAAPAKTGDAVRNAEAPDQSGETPQVSKLPDKKQPDSESPEKPQQPAQKP